MVLLLGGDRSDFASPAAASITSWLAACYDASLLLLYFPHGRPGPRIIVYLIVTWEIRFTPFEGNVWALRDNVTQGPLNATLVQSRAASLAATAGHLHAYCLINLTQYEGKSSFVRSK